MSASEPPLRRPAPQPPDQVKCLYSDKLKTNISWDNKLKRNVLEITLDRMLDSSEDINPE